MNIVEALGGPEGVELTIEQAWEDSFNGRFDHNNLIFRHQVNAEDASEQYPLTDIRIPNYYRDRQLEVRPILQGQARSRNGNGWAGVYHYHWAGNRLDLIRGHDALLLKIVQHTFAKLANNPKVEWKHGFDGKYTLLSKRSYTEGVPEPDMTLVGQVKWHFDKMFWEGLAANRFAACLSNWIAQPNLRERVDQDCRRILDGKERQLWLAAMRLLKPFTANQRARLAIPTAKDAPTTQSCFELLKYFSNNYDVPFDLALQHAQRQLVLNRRTTDLQEAIRLKNANIATMMEEVNFATSNLQT